METYIFWSIRAPGPRGRRVEDDDAGIGTCGNWNVCLVLFAASQAAKARLENMSVSQWSCVFTWASSRVAFSWTGDRGRLCRLHAASVRDDCLHAFSLWQPGARLDASCGFYDRVCYQKYTHRQHLARLEESARGDAEGDRHHQWATATVWWGTLSSPATDLKEKPNRARQTVAAVSHRMPLQDSLGVK